MKPWIKSIVELSVQIVVFMPIHHEDHVFGRVFALDFPDSDYVVHDLDVPPRAILAASLDDTVQHVVERELLEFVRIRASLHPLPQLLLQRRACCEKGPNQVLHPSGRPVELLGAVPLERRAVVGRDPLAPQSWLTGGWPIRALYV